MCCEAAQAAYTWPKKEVGHMTLDELGKVLDEMERGKCASITHDLFALAMINAMGA